MLISAGADVSAVNLAGQSVLDVARWRAEYDPGKHCVIGSFPVDAWLTVLEKCGHRAVDIVGSSALDHKLRFTSKYTQEHYRAMQEWVGGHDTYCVSERGLLTEQ
jgi:hypothetical protein